MIRFTKAHAYGNDFLYVLQSDVSGLALDVLARRLCDRHAGIGADGLIVYEPARDGASMRLFNADGSLAEVSGNGVRGLAAILLRGDDGDTRVERDGARHVFRAAMGLPDNLREIAIEAAGESIRAVAMTFGNPQCVVLGALPEEARFRTLGPAIERAPIFPQRTNVEFASIERPDRIRIVIWERGVGPTLSSGTGSCAALIAAAAFGGADRDATVAAPGGAQHVEWRHDSVYLTGWAEITVDGRWLASIAESAT